MASGSARNHMVASKALRMCWGILPGVTGITSKRISCWTPAGLRASHSSAAACDDVDFAERRLKAAGEDAIALGDQKHGGAALGRKPKLEGGQALGLGRAGRSKRLGAACRYSASRSFSSASTSARW
jgi:hypothetical protein